MTPKAGYVVPPENSAGLYPVSGEPIFKAKCAQCHEPAVGRAPTKELLAARAPEEVYDALTIGAMKPMAAGLSDAELYGVTRFITGKSPVPNAPPVADTNLCKTNGPLQPNGPQWNGWGRDVANSRYQPKPGFTAADVPQLKLKWAFAYPGSRNSRAAGVRRPAVRRLASAARSIRSTPGPAASTGATTGPAARAPR